jgi:hypothetical protein
MAIKRDVVENRESGAAEGVILDTLPHCIYGADEGCADDFGGGAEVGRVRRLDRIDEVRMQGWARVREDVA